MRPLLKPALRRFWRDETTVQLGLDPRRALVLGNLDPPLAAALDLLDGTRDRDQLVAELVRRGADPDECAELLALLTRAGVLDDASHPLGEWGLLPPQERDRLAPDLAGLSLRHHTPGRAVDILARRRRAHVAVCGLGRVGAPLAAHLVAGGVGAITLLDSAPARPADVAAGGLAAEQLGRARATAAQDALLRITDTARVAASDAVPAAVDLVVLAGVGDLDPRALLDTEQTIATHRLPHLYAAVRDQVAVIGPYVVPGVTSCARCHHLVRTDRDPAWPRVAASLRGGRRDADGGEAALAAVTASLGALQALAVLDGEPSPVADATLELGLPDWQLRRRSWPAHPDCPCAAGRLAG